jgi:hypothetical protein
MTNYTTRRNFIKITTVGIGALALGGLGFHKLLKEAELRPYIETHIILGTYVTIKSG